MENKLNNIIESKEIEDFESEMENIFFNLAQNQEILGSEFSSVLYDNLWELYQN